MGAMSNKTEGNNPKVEVVLKMALGNFYNIDFPAAFRTVAESIVKVLQEQGADKYSNEDEAADCINGVLTEIANGEIEMSKSIKDFAHNLLPREQVHLLNNIGPKKIETCHDKNITGQYCFTISKLGEESDPMFYPITVHWRGAKDDPRAIQNAKWAMDPNGEILKQLANGEEIDPKVLAGTKTMDDYKDDVEKMKKIRRKQNASNGIKKAGTVGVTTATGAMLGGPGGAIAGYGVGSIINSTNAHKDSKIKNNLRDDVIQRNPQWNLIMTKAESLGVKTKGKDVDEVAEEILSHASPMMLADLPKDLNVIEKAYRLLGGEPLPAEPAPQGV